MAKRFGGEFSPDGKNSGADPSKPVRARRSPAGRTQILYLPAIVLAATSLNDGPVALITGLVGGATLALAAYLLHEGITAEDAYNARKVARRPALPRKVLATALTGVGVAIAAFMGDAGITGSALYGLAAAGLHIATFGIDPMSDKRMEGVDTFQQDRVARVVDEAETNLNVMKAQIEALSDRRLTARVADFQIIARRMIRTVEEDPRDLTSARKFLGIYLMGARDATVKFVDLYGPNRDADLRASYEALLTDLQHNFATRTDKMMRDDRSDMDIEIKVLRDRLQREGVNLKAKGN